ncbi:MAG: ABC transporter permease [Methanothrix sp.]|uniref:ABC transporter permease n=1 Tax=Methanothrix sp. TaxID=90426 RepID=UPI0025F86FDD|nr:ABC transporter permease [Methanothrix sp.]MCQ8903936.1 ABC transporter permease [Methanothrix sp.]
MSHLEQLRRSLAIAEKDVWIYYAKGPVMVFGIIFPLFLIMAFTIGRNMTVVDLFPGLMGMAIFFTSTAVGPAILPWETRSRTLERLVTAPVEVWALLLGDVIASFVFGILISLIPLSVAVLMGVEVLHAAVFVLGMLLATFCFASLSILLSVYPPTDVPATVMMLSSLVRFPMVFISGVFVPVDQLPGWGRAISSVSPLTYFVDLARYSISGISYYSAPVDLAVMTVFAVVFLVVAIKLHERFLPQRFS